MDHMRFQSEVTHNTRISYWQTVDSVASYTILLTSALAAASIPWVRGSRRLISTAVVLEVISLSALVSLRTWRCLHPLIETQEEMLLRAEGFMDYCLSATSLPLLGLSRGASAPVVRRFHLARSLYEAKLGHDGMTAKGAREIIDQHRQAIAEFVTASTGTIRPQDSGVPGLLGSALTLGMPDTLDVQETLGWLRESQSDCPEALWVVLFGDWRSDSVTTVLQLYSGASTSLKGRLSQVARHYIQVIQGDGPTDDLTAWIRREALRQSFQGADVVALRAQNPQTWKMVFGDLDPAQMSPKVADLDLECLAQKLEKVLHGDQDAIMPTAEELQDLMQLWLAHHRTEADDLVAHLRSVAREDSEAMSMLSKVFDRAVGVYRCVWVQENWNRELAKHLNEVLDQMIPKSRAFQKLALLYACAKLNIDPTLVSPVTLEPLTDAVIVNCLSVTTEIRLTLHRLNEEDAADKTLENGDVVKFTKCYECRRDCVIPSYTRDHVTRSLVKRFLALT